MVFFAHGFREPVEVEAETQREGERGVRKAFEGAGEIKVPEASCRDVLDGLLVAGFFRRLLQKKGRVLEIAKARVAGEGASPQYFGVTETQESRREQGRPVAQDVAPVGAALDWRRAIGPGADERLLPGRDLVAAGLGEGHGVAQPG